MSSVAETRPGICDTHIPEVWTLFLAEIVILWTESFFSCWCCPYCRAIKKGKDGRGRKTGKLCAIFVVRTTGDDAIPADVGYIYIYSFGTAANNRDKDLYANGWEPDGSVEQQQIREKGWVLTKPFIFHFSIDYFCGKKCKDLTPLLWLPPLGKAKPYMYYHQPSALIFVRDFFDI